jgi:hypothetical protein
MAPNGFGKGVRDPAATLLSHQLKQGTILVGTGIDVRMMFSDEQASYPEIVVDHCSV